MVGVFRPCGRAMVMLWAHEVWVAGLEMLVFGSGWPDAGGSSSVMRLGLLVWPSRADGVASWRDRCPSSHGRAQAEHGEAGEVLCRGEEAEVGVHFASASHAGPSSPVFASHQVAELAFDLGAGGPVIGDPVGVLLVTASVGQPLLVAANPDRAAAPGVGAVGSQGAGSAGVGERGGPGAFAMTADRDGDPGRAGDGVGVEVDSEAIFGEPPVCRRGRLGFATRVDVVLGQLVQEFAGAIGGVAIDGGWMGATISTGLGRPATAKLRLASRLAGLGPASASGPFVLVGASALVP